MRAPFVVFDLVLSCGVVVVGASIIIEMSISIPFPFWVAAERKGSQS